MPGLSLQERLRQERLRVERLKLQELKLKLQELQEQLEREQLKQKQEQKWKLLQEVVELFQQAKEDEQKRQECIKDTILSWLMVDWYKQQLEFTHLSPAATLLMSRWEPTDTSAQTLYNPPK